jgi:hypothetical protein
VRGRHEGAEALQRAGVEDGENGRRGGRHE